MLKIDIGENKKNYPLIEYEVFYPLNNGNIEILNLSFCEGINIELTIPVKINGTLDKYNPKSNYYNDICTKATSGCNTDITLGDRRNEFIKNNLSLCEINCELIGYNYNNNKAKCSCNVKNTLSLDNIELDSKNLIKNFLDFKKIMNIEIIKCYKIVFNKNNMKNNYGFFIIAFIFILYFLCMFIFYCKSIKSLIDEITKILRAKINEPNKINKNENFILNNNNTKIVRNKYRKKPKIESKSTIKEMKEENKVIITKKNIKKNYGKIEKVYQKDTEKLKSYKNILGYTESELNSLSYKEALINDKRNYCQYYFSLIKKKQSIFFSFYPNKDYNSQIIKSFLFFFFYASDITVNALFFTDDTMHKIYIDSGLFDINYQLPQIVYSSLISGIINVIIEYLSLSENAISLIKTQKHTNLNKKKKIISGMKTKFHLFFITSFILLLVFWYYTSCFCCIYQNTQIHLIKDSLVSLVISLAYPFFINLIPSIFRISSLKNKKSNKVCIYNLSQVIEFIT